MAHPKQRLRQEGINEERTTKLQHQPWPLIQQQVKHIFSIEHIKMKESCITRQVVIDATETEKHNSV